MTINYKVPFYGNTEEGTHCFQACIKMVLKYFQPEKDFTIEELEKITAKKPGLWTWCYAGLVWLAEHGFDVVNIDSFDSKRFSEEGKSYLFEALGDQVAQANIDLSDINQEIFLAKEFVSRVHTINREASIDDILEYLNKGYLVVCVVNSRALNNKEGYSGHFVLIKGYDEKGLIVHDPGHPHNPDRLVEYDLFNRAWSSTPKSMMAFFYPSTS